MPDRNIWLFTAAALVVVMLFFNRNVRLCAVLKEQIKVFKNAKKQRISLWDCLCFLVFPWVFSYICVYQLDFVIEEELAQLLTTVFSIVFTVLFGFAAVMVGKIHKTEKQVAEETFVSIVSANLMSLIAAILSIVLTQTKSEIIVKISSVVLLGSSLIIILLLLLITKRTFFLYVDNKD